jgi:hypothetical protein
MHALHALFTPLEPRMQSIRTAESTVKTLDLTTTELQPTGPIELDLETLEQVGGGLSPKGTWATAAVVESPKGTW